MFASLKIFKWLFSYFIGFDSSNQIKSNQTKPDRMTFLTGPVEIPYLSYENLSEYLVTFRKNFGIIILNAIDAFFLHRFTTGNCQIDLNRGLAWMKKGLSGVHKREASFKNVLSR